MRKNIKTEIIQAARSSFNERGYDAVSTQDIADMLGISKGNLNYHFKRKEDILEAVVEEMHSHYVRPEIPATLEGLERLLSRAQKIARENAFYFWDYTQFGLMSEKIRRIQRKVIRDERVILKETFRQLEQKGTLQKESYPGQYVHVVETIILTCIYQMPYSVLEGEDKPKMDLFDHVRGILYPLLTETGKDKISLWADQTSQMEEIKIEEGYRKDECDADIGAKKDCL